MVSGKEVIIDFPDLIIPSQIEAIGIIYCFWMLLLQTLYKVNLSLVLYEPSKNQKNVNLVLQRKNKYNKLHNVYKIVYISFAQTGFSSLAICKHYFHKGL